MSPFGDRPPTLGQLRQMLAEEALSCEDLVGYSLQQIRDSPASFVEVFEASALAAARAADARRRVGAPAGPLDGIPVAVKDLLDVRGSQTRAGLPASKAARLARAARPADKDAVVVERLKAAGAIIIGKTQLTELAFSGVGHNPHHAAVLSPTGRAPGGSSSGSAAAVARGQVPVALGSDTGGSVRIPAALCGITGFKPSFGLVPTSGCWPLAPRSLDTIGPLAHCVDDCAEVFRVLAGCPGLDPTAPLSPPRVDALRLLVPLPVAWDALDAPVAAAFSASIAALRAAGAVVVEANVPLQVSHLEALRVIISYEAATANADLLSDATMRAGLDGPTRGRLEFGEGVSAAQYSSAKMEQQEAVALVDMHTRGYDAMLMPTCPIVPPTVHDLQSDEALNRALVEVCRFTRFVNLLGRCAISLPCHLAAPNGAEQLPVGLMLVGDVGKDEHCLGIAKAVETVLRSEGLGEPLRKSPAGAPSTRMEVAAPPARKRAAAAAPGEDVEALAGCCRKELRTAAPTADVRVQLM